MICIILTRVYYCRGLPSSFEGYFVLPAALSLIKVMHMSFSCTYYMVVCRYIDRNTKEHRLNFLDHFIQILFIYLKKNFFLIFSLDANCPAFLLPTCIFPGEKQRSWKEAQSGHSELSVNDFAGNQDSPFRGKVLFCGFFGFCFCMFHC